jgi:hypothetical protein
MKHDLIGKKFNNLTILYRSTAKFDSGEYPWFCRCDCGNEVNIRACHLYSNKMKSCGCLKNADLSSDAAFKVLFSRYKSVAIEREMQFLLNEVTFKNIVTKSCFYCGNVPTQETIRKSKHGISKFTYNGIDRKDSNIGYVEYNCVPCCGICNRAKHSMSHYDFMNWIHRIKLFN